MGGVQTISLHNIRYETRAGGDELWRIDGEDELRLAEIARSEDGEGWEVLAMGVPVLTYRDKAAAREVLAVFLKEAGKLRTDLT